MCYSYIRVTTEVEELNNHKEQREIIITWNDPLTRGYRSIFRVPNSEYKHKGSLKTKD